MKKLILTFALAFSASLVTQAQPVYSNTVGMIKITIPANQFVFVGVPFGSSVPQTLNDLIGDQLTAGSSFTRGADQIIAWNAAAQEYQNFFKRSTDNQWWKSDRSAVADIQLVPGTGFWVISNQDSQQELVISGNVPTEADYSFTTFDGFNQFGFPYPVAMDINDPKFALAAAATGGSSFTRGSDQLLVWDVVTEEYVSFYKSSSTGQWHDAITREVAVYSLTPGQGFWFRKRSTSALAWEPQLPYTLD